MADNTNDFDLDSDHSSDSEDVASDTLDDANGLAEWAAEYNISQNALSALLKNLRQKGLNVPLDARTLMSTVRKCDVKNIAGGSYYHFGIKNSIQVELASLDFDLRDLTDTLTLRVNIDGLPLFRSNNVSLWPILELRTDQTFREMGYEEHQGGVSPLCELGVGLVSGFVLDYMHLVCLGAMRQLIYLWLKGPLKCRQSIRILTTISAFMASIRQYLPRNFARKPRSLLEISMWKATELRQFLLYTGPVVLRKNIPDIMYSNFILSSVSIRILLSPDLCTENCDFAEDILKMFVPDFGLIYGIEFVGYNIHSLIHISQDARKYGPLDSISCFPFETYLGKLKKMARRPQSPVQQIVRRIHEKQRVAKQKKISIFCPLKKLHLSGPLTDELQTCQQYRQYNDGQTLISCHKGDNCFSLGGRILIVRNILLSSCGTVKQFKVRVLGKADEEFDGSGHDHPSSVPLPTPVPEDLQMQASTSLNIRPFIQSPAPLMPLTAVTPGQPRRFLQGASSAFRDLHLPPPMPNNLQLQTPQPLNTRSFIQPPRPSTALTPGQPSRPLPGATSGFREGMFVRLLTILEEIKETQRVHGRMIQALLTQRDGTTVATLPEDIIFPLKTVSDVDAMEQKLADPTLQKQVMGHMSIGMVKISETGGNEQWDCGLRGVTLTLVDCSPPKFVDYAQFPYRLWICLRFVGYSVGDQLLPYIQHMAKMMESAHLDDVH
ncbi:hypothetical protein E1301_Tti021314 [Triplophysa tibetana]|uniref:Uncharacterized protein n=1 Tax=Triplophysa tibetana TaxID=1572043 RepID=A0A5A9MXL3_9TELE|nr:hypothetical protein E1301_Tti021314 [Triplophysa tibetana]